jgi:hypothetical protein
VKFLDLPERINRLLYRRSLQKLTRQDLILARAWTLQLIRDSHPHWSEIEVEAYYEKLSLIRVEVVDEWSKRFGLDAPN